MTVEENVRFTSPNFFLDTSDDSFYTLEQSSELLRKVDSDGTLVASFPVETPLAGLDWVNPVTCLQRTGDTFESGSNQGNASVWSLEPYTGGLLLRRYVIRDGICWFATTRKGNTVRPDVFNLASQGPNRFESTSFAVDDHVTSLSVSALAGASTVTLTSVSGMTSSSRLVLGPSTRSGYEGKTEEVLVQGVNTTTKVVTLKTPLVNGYLSSDVANYHSYIYLFNNHSYGFTVPPGIDQGGFYTLSAIDGGIVTANSGVQYKDITACTYDQTSQRVLMVRGNQLLFFNPTTRTFSSSLVMNNEDQYKTGALQVFDLSSDSTSFYRLQTSQVDEDGNLVVFDSPGIYNYVTTQRSAYPASISTRVERETIFAEENDQTYIYVLTRDQYGVAFPTQVAISASGDNAGTFLVVDGHTTQATTDSYGRATFLYKSGEGSDIIPFLVTTAPSFTLESSFVVHQFLMKEEEARLSQSDPPSGTFRVNQNSDDGAGSCIVETEKKVSHPPVRGSFRLGTEDEQYRDYTNGERDVDWPYWIQDLEDEGFSVGNGHPTKTMSPATLTQSNIQISTSVRITQRAITQSFSNLTQQDKTFASTGPAWQREAVTGTAEVEQVNLIQTILPVPFSSKNPRSSSFYFLLNYPGFPIDLASFVLYVNGVDVSDSITVSTTGLTDQVEVEYDPPVDFSYGERVFVTLEFYDTATPDANFYDLIYYFDITPDFRAPVLLNKNPEEGEVEVDREGSIQFDVVDTDNDVDMDTFFLYVDSTLITSYTSTRISNGYRITYTSPEPFEHLRDVSVYVHVEDVAGNVLDKSYRFITESSVKPDIVPLTPDNCALLTHRDTPSMFGIFTEGDGVELRTIRLIVNGVERNISVKPLVRRNY